MPQSYRIAPTAVLNHDARAAEIDRILKEFENRMEGLKVLAEKASSFGRRGRHARTNDGRQGT
jgi:hypothetical protein